jgi:hypothetical protein
MKILLVAIFSLFISTQTSAQQKNRNKLQKFWIGASTALLNGTANKKLGTAFFIDAGLFLKHNYMLGIGGGAINFDEKRDATIFYGYAEKNIGNNKRKLFFYAKPGITLPSKPKEQFATISRFDFEKAKLGMHLQSGVGIRWMVNRHSFFISTGFSKTTYSFTAKQYTVPVDPYNPFYEEAIIHQYKLAFTRMQFNMGFTF